MRQEFGRSDLCRPNGAVCATPKICFKSNLARELPAGATRKSPDVGV